MTTILSIIATVLAFYFGGIIAGISVLVFIGLVSSDGIASSDDNSYQFSETSGISNQFEDFHVNGQMDSCGIDMY